MNSLELYIKDIKNALNNNLYFAALALSLTIPDICGMIMYPDLYSKKRYIKWYDEYLGQYEESPRNEEREEKMPFLNGEACYELRCAILHEGRNNIEDRELKSINLDKFTLLLEEKNSMDSYCDGASVGGFEHKSTLDIQVRNICNKIVWVVEGLIEKSELDISKAPNINVKDYGAEIRRLKDYNYQAKRAMLKPRDKYEPIYKYCSVESAKSILSNNCVILNNPKKFNDPFDSIIDISKEDEDKSREIVYSFYIFNEIDKFLNEKKLPLKGLQKLSVGFYKSMYRKYKKMAIKAGIFEANKMMLSITRFFIGMLPKEEIEKSREEFAKQVTERIKNVRSSVLMSCFSKRYDSTLMWSHYADKHRGVCIEFERPDDFSDVRYKSVREPFDLVGVTKRCLAYMLDGNEINYSDLRLINKISSPLLTKSEDWAYEQEVRCIFTSFTSLEDLEMLDFDKYLYFMPTMIRKVYLGVNMSEAEKTEIESICQKLKIEVVDTKLSDDEYKIEIAK